MVIRNSLLNSNRRLNSRLHSVSPGLRGNSKECPCNVESVNRVTVMRPAINCKRLIGRYETEPEQECSG